MATYLPNDETETAPVLVSRQPVLDSRDRVVGYRISYSLVSGGSPVTPTADEELGLVDDVLAIINRDEQVLGNMAHLTLSREMLLRGEVPRARPEQVLLRVRYEDATAQTLAPVIEAAAGRGYRMELDGLPGPVLDHDLIDYFSAIEIDVSRWDLGEAASAVAEIRKRGAVALASRVRTYNDREQAKSLGFEWFSGRFFATPNTIAGEPIPIGDLGTFVELYRMQRGDAPLEELVALIEQEVGLGVRLLRYINSAYFGYSGRVRSITQAATMLGTNGLSRWALIVAALSGSDPIPRELALLALTRARACELVGLDYDDELNNDELFTIGLLSACDAVFRMPMRMLVDELPLAENVSQALIDRTGSAGQILQAVIAYEQGEFQAPSLRPMLVSNSAAYREALDWARRAVYGMP